MIPSDLSAEDISHRLGTCPWPPEAEVGNLQTESSLQAAVLLPLFQVQGNWRVLYIRRAENTQDHHSGQVAFPGGRLEPGERDPARAALREAREEIGLAEEGVDLLGQLPLFHTFSGYRVIPVVGRIPWPLPLVPEPREVARIFSIPLRWLADPNNHELRPWPAPEHPAARPVIFFRKFAGERLWGVSAHITLNLVKILLS